MPHTVALKGEIESKRGSLVNLQASWSFGRGGREIISFPEQLFLMNLNKPIQEDSINWYALHVYRNKVSNCRDMVNAINPISDIQESEKKESEKKESEKQELDKQELERQRKLRNILKDRTLSGGVKWPFTHRW